MFPLQTSVRLRAVPCMYKARLIAQVSAWNVLCFYAGCGVLRLRSRLRFGLCQGRRSLWRCGKIEMGKLTEVFDGSGIVYSRCVLFGFVVAQENSLVVDSYSSAPLLIARREVNTFKLGCATAYRFLHIPGILNRSTGPQIRTLTVNPVVVLVVYFYFRVFNSQNKPMELYDFTLPVFP